jgi:hypothetical protein
MKRDRLLAFLLIRWFLWRSATEPETPLSVVWEHPNQVVLVTPVSGQEIGSGDHKKL